MPHRDREINSMPTQPSTTQNDLLNQLIGYVLTHFKPLWDLVQSFRPAHRWLNKTLTNSAVLVVPIRPYPFSTMANYTSWSSLTDRTWTSRHLPESDKDLSKFPSPEAIAERLFLRQGPAQLDGKSTLLFPYFAQWFTDGFLRTDREALVERKQIKNTSNHDIDLSPLYGPTPEVTKILRSHQGGKLKSQMINGEEYPPYYYQENGAVHPDFVNLPNPVPEHKTLDPAKKAKLFAMGTVFGNFQIGYVMLSSLVLREHNRICDELAQRYPTWDDERLFQTARNILIVLLIKIVLEEYINHISPFNFRFIVDPIAFKDAPWYRTNWMALEFDLVYRWHSMIPDKVIIEGRELKIEDTLYNNELVTEKGLGIHFEAASQQASGRLGVKNTPGFLLNTEVRSIELDRLGKLKSYNDYREYCKMPRVTDFNQISVDPNIQNALKELYGTVDNIELYVGLYSEDNQPNSPLPALVGRLVSIDAFSQALTNPLLAENVFNEQTFTPYGMDLIQKTQNLSQLLHRNIPKRDRPFKVTMTQTH